ncbi:MAG: phosphoribosylanthranilate isomerase [Kiritimatiellia bacterium]
MKNSYKLEIKICGITNLDDARAAMDAGADYLGFVLYKKSPRAVLPENLRRMVNRLGGKIRTVGVFVNEPASSVARIAADCGLDIVQLCGSEKPGSYRSVSAEIWRVIRLQDGRPQPDPAAWNAERYVLDSARAGLYGGTGMAMDWDAAAKISAQHKIMLAGGLTPDNVATAVRIVQPFGVDVSSGVESRPGKKDPDKIRFFIETAKHACYNESIGSKK